MSNPAPSLGAIELKGICKSYGPVRALDDVSCTLFPGEVHAIVGENGAGKSTLAFILCGFVTPDRGAASFGDPSQPTDLTLGDSGRVRQMGIELIHQHFTLVPDLSVEENLALSHIPGLAARLNLRAWSEPSLRVGRELGWKFDPSTMVRDLSVGEQQRLEIIRVLGNDPGVIVFDEPTAVLAPAEVHELLRVLANLRDQGRVVVLIAHKLSEVMEIADRVTVLRKGAKVVTAEKGTFDAKTLAEWMVGEVPTLDSGPAAAAPEPGLSVAGLTVKGDRGNVAVNDFSLEIGKGEIVGIGGVDGNGQLELAESLALVRPFIAGSLRWKGRDFNGALTIGYIPQDRRKDGLMTDLSVLDNFMLAGIRRREFFFGTFIKQNRVVKWAKELIGRFSIKADSPFQPVGRLSGGNQQKVVVSRTLDRVPDLLVVCNPSRGLDVRATEFVHSQILWAKSRGSATLLISSDLDELGLLADRLFFLSAGRIAEGTSAMSVVGGTESA